MTITMRGFRFGLVSGYARDAGDWIGQARSAESAGFDTFLIPDNLGGLAPTVALMAAAACTSTLRVGPYVLATPLRPAAAIAQEVATAHLLSRGRFEVGLGAGRPDAAGEAAALGVRFGSPAQRLEALAAAIEAVRARAADVPVLVAGAGPRLLDLAARTADIVAIGVPPDADEDVLAAKAAQVRAAAAGRVGGALPELSCNHLLAGDAEDVPAYVRERMGLDVGSLVAAGAASVLQGTPRQIAARLLRRRDRTGISYLTVAAASAPVMARVVALLDGR